MTALLLPSAAPNACVVVTPVAAVAVAMAAVCLTAELPSQGALTMLFTKDGLLLFHACVTDEVVAESLCCAGSVVAATGDTPLVLVHGWYPPPVRDTL